MSPQEIVTLLTQATLFLAPIASTELVKTGVKDAYTAVKTWLGNKDTESADILAKLETKPESKGYALTLDERMTELHLTTDEDFISLLQQLSQAMKDAKAPDLRVTKISSEGDIAIDNDQLRGQAVFDDIRGAKGVTITNKQGKA